MKFNLTTFLGIAFCLTLSTMLSLSPAFGQTSSSNSSSSIVQPQGLTDDQKLPCAALICLSSPQGQSTSDCNPAISAFNSIHANNWSDTFQDRLDWLNKCPSATENQQMQNLAVAIVNGSQGCDPATLNRVLRVVVGGCGGDCGSTGTVEISNSMPAYCSDYYSNSYIQLGNDAPVYVGTPETGGFWTDPANLQAAQTQYEAKLAAMQAAEQAASRESGGN